ncbi:PP2C family protein-serine/threonine phosphatase [Acidimangrovimonas pyrenivorans]|uniref:PP2C family protein-serine/threonine phosphatase n=1 Tax=Acidimangrovimonas pyrenivorans TaxID=2030798 RepID=A0ABV7AGJ4_9RHOB
MSTVSEIGFDTATATSRGSRPHQEDAIVTDFPIGGELALAVLADGMGGHAAGDVASKIAVTEVFSELKLQSGDPTRLETELPGLLREAALSANDCIKSHADNHEGTRGMGTTLVALALLDTRLYWLSVGDSPLLLHRDGALRQLNEDHSMAPQIDMLVQAGQMSQAEASGHPDRNCLTSALCGIHVPRIDCPDTPFALREGDTVILASDGLQFLPEAQISAILARHAAEGSARVAQALLAALDAQAHPDQDNATFAVIRAIPAARTGRVMPLRVEPTRAETVASNSERPPRGATGTGRPARWRTGFLFGRTALPRSGSQ